MKAVKLFPQNGNGKPRTERKLLTRKQALKELKNIYHNKEIFEIERYLNRGVLLGDGKGTFYQTTVIKQG